MVAYSFKKQFIAPIRDETKAQTIRADRARHARESETLQLYTGMRTKQCMLIGTAICTAALPIRFDFQRPSIELPGRRPITRANGWRALNRFAIADGFENWEALHAFWAREHDVTTSWSGILIRWAHFKLPAHPTSSSEAVGQF